MTKNGLGNDSQLLTGLSIMIAGKNTFGYTGDGTKPPEFEFETVNEQSTGLVKQPTMTLEVLDLHPMYITHIASGAPFILKGNLRQDGEDTPLLVTVQGEVTKISAEMKEGDAAKRTFELRVDMYTELVNALPSIVYTRSPYSLFLGGIPMAPDFSNNI